MNKSDQELILLRKDINYLKRQIEQQHKDRIIFQQVIEGIKTFITLAFESTTIMKEPLKEK